MHLKKKTYNLSSGKKEIKQVDNTDYFKSMTIYLHDNVKIHLSNILSNICTQLSCLDSKDSTNVNFSLKQIKFLDAELTHQCLSIPYQCA